MSMSTSAITGAKSDVLRAALRCIDGDYQDPNANSDAEAEYSDEELARASLKLVDAVDSAPDDEKPVAWRKGHAIVSSPLHRLHAAVNDTLGGLTSLVITSTIPIAHHGATIPEPMWTAALPVIGSYKFAGKFTFNLPHDDMDYDRRDLVGSGVTADEAITELLRLLGRITWAQVLPPDSVIQRGGHVFHVAWNAATGRLEGLKSTGGTP
ncbi:hypothetical protein AB0B89_36215 [Sphaerisporangium sp. NPDC049002]|uniref:hypothetical protein n=1 Tax=Sphaerisporangium sp. NPDC049002 TaxID=3155392 RepID=UPI003406F1A0